MKLQKVKQALESFFYKVRYNIAIQNALKSIEYKGFRDKVHSAIEKQILHFATIEKVNQITGVHKAVGKLTEIDLLHNLKKHWVSLDTFLKPDDFRDYLLFAAILGGQDALDKMKVNEEFDLTNKELISTIKRRAVLSMREIDKTTQSWIARTIEQNYAVNHVEIARLLHSEAKKKAEMRSDLISENELALMMNRIEIETYERNGINFCRWITNKDELTCVTCMANEEAGNVKVGEVFPGYVAHPPQHINCILSGQKVWGVGISAKIVSSYDGPAIRITTAKGSNCSITPNHLMLTNRGWIRASKINHGDYLISTRPSIKKVEFANPNIKPIESLIENIVVSDKVIFRQMPSSTIDFRGDEIFCKNVNIIYPTGSLRPNIFNRFFKFIDYDYFIRTLTKKRFFSSLRHFAQLIKTKMFTFYRFVGSLRIFNIFFFGSFSHHKPIGFHIISDLNVISNEKISYSSSTNSKIVGDFVRSNSTFVFLDKVRSINRVKNFHGKVYDLTTSGGWYTVNGIITHNCRCFLKPVIDKKLENIWKGN